MNKLNEPHCLAGVVKTESETTIRVRVSGQLVGPGFPTNGDALEWIEVNVPAEKSATLCDVKASRHKMVPTNASKKQKIGSEEQ